MGDKEPQTCPDGHTCKNGALCIENPDREGAYMCDCETSPESVYAGFSCEHEATVFCNHEGRESYTSFCTNQGTCVANVSAVDGDHLGCICRPAYTGDFCEFVKGTGMNRYRSHNGGSSGGGADGAVVALSVVATLVGAACLLAVFFLYKRRHAHTLTSEAKGMKSSDLHLDADGEVLRSSQIHLATTSKAKVGPDSPSQQPPTPTQVVPTMTESTDDDDPSASQGVETFDVI